MDRISSILTNLIREANDAVHGMEQERANLMRRSNTSARSSRIPRPVSVAGRTRGQECLVASFERLDTSMALIDSLSRDLAHYHGKEPSSYYLQHREHLYPFLLLPFLYGARSLLLSLSSTALFPASSLVTLVALVIFLALSNLVVDHVCLSTRQEESSRPSMPGAYSLAGQDDISIPTAHHLSSPPPSTDQDPHSLLTSHNTRHRRRSSHQYQHKHQYQHHHHYNNINHHHHHHHHRVSTASRRSLYRKRLSPRKLPRPVLFAADEHLSRVSPHTESHHNRLKRSFSF